MSSLPPRARVVSVAAANKHSAAVTSSGDVFTWGANSSGQLGYGTPDSGYNPTPRLVDSLKGKTLVTVAAAKRHTGGGMLQASCHHSVTGSVAVAVAAVLLRLH